MKMFQIYPYDADHDLLGKRRYTVWISALFLVGSILLLALVGPRWGIDFQGGTEIIVEFEETVEAEDVREAAEAIDLADPLVQQFGGDDDNQFMLQTRDVAVVGDDDYDAIIEELAQIEHHQMTDPMEEQPDRMQVRFDEAVSEEALHEAVAAGGIEELELQETGQRDEHWYVLNFQDLQRHIEDGLSEYFGDDFDEAGGIQRLESVGPRAGEQLRNDGMLAMIIALGAILLYIWVRFDIRYSPGAVAALGHDITIALGLFIVLDIEFSLPIVAALLTIIGYSLNDTIVVFDRIRENLESAGGRSVEAVANKAINQTMSRTLVTSLTTLVAVGTIAVVATGLIQDFAMALVVGVIIGTYSSVFVASPVMLKMDEYLKEREKAEELLDEQRGDEPETETGPVV